APGPVGRNDLESGLAGEDFQGAGDLAAGAPVVVKEPAAGVHEEVGVPGRDRVEGAHLVDALRDEDAGPGVISGLGPRSPTTGRVASMNSQQAAPATRTAAYTYRAGSHCGRPE